MEIGVAIFLLLAGGVVGYLLRPKIDKLIGIE